MGKEDTFSQLLFEKQSVQNSNDFDGYLPLIVFVIVLVVQIFVGG